MARFALPEGGEVWGRMQIGWDDCPHLHSEANKLERVALLQDLGRDDAFIRSYLFGEVGVQGQQDRVFGPEDVAAAKLAMRAHDDPELSDTIPFIGTKGEYRAASDVSGGGDKQILMIAEGNRMVFSQEWNEPNNVRMAVIHLELVRQFGIPPHRWYVDGGGGYGDSFCDALELPESSGGLGFPGVVRYLNNNVSRMPDRYRDRITQDHAHLKKLLVTIPMVLIPNDALLLQMRRRRWAKDDSNRYKLEQKKLLRHRGEQSPDDLDTLVMLFADWSPDTHRPILKARSKNRDPLDPHFDDMTRALEPQLGSEAFGGMADLGSLSGGIGD